VGIGVGVSAGVVIDKATGESMRALSRGVVR
jgi:hypothetical protein